MLKQVDLRNIRESTKMVLLKSGVFPFRYYFFESLLIILHKMKSKSVQYLTLNIFGFHFLFIGNFLKKFASIFLLINFSITNEFPYPSIAFQTFKNTSTRFKPILKAQLLEDIKPKFNNSRRALNS